MQNIEELRNCLAEDYDKLRAKEIDIKLAKELANTAGKIINSLKVEIEYNNIMGIKEVIPFLQKNKK